MRYNALGLSGVDISRIGPGSSAIGGTSRGPQDDDISVRTIHEALGSGVNWIHTGPVYGGGHAETVYGRAIAALPASERPFIFTMSGFDFDGDHTTASGFDMRFDLSPKRIRTQLEGSLRRLGVDHVDLLQFHWPDANVPIEESWGSVGDLVQEGKVRMVGLSNHGPDLLERAEAIRHVDAIQVPLSLLERSLNGPFPDEPTGQKNGNSGGPGVLPWARAHGTGVLAYAALQHGLLSGRFSVGRMSEVEASGETLRPLLYWFKEPHLSRGLALAEGLRPVALRQSTTVAAVATAWVLAWPVVSAVIYGARKESHVREMVDAAHLELTSVDLDEIAGVLERTGAGVGTPGDGPTRPLYSI